MKRRGFFGAMLGIAAAPVAAEVLPKVEKVVEATEPPKLVTVEKVALGDPKRQMRNYYDDMTCCIFLSSTVGTTTTLAGEFSDADWDDSEDEEE